MSASWTDVQAEGRALLTSLQTSSNRLQATLNMIYNHRTQSRSLQPHLDAILALLESSQRVHQVNALALQVLMALGHWVTALNLWPRWEILLRHYIRVAEETHQREVMLILTIYLCEIVHQMGRAAEALQIASEGFSLADQTISPQTTGQLLIKVVWSALMLNDLPRARQALDMAQTLQASLTPSDQIVLQAYWLCAAADYVRRNGNIARAVQLGRASVRLFDQNPNAHPSSRATAHRICGVYEWAFGSHRRALKYFKRAAQLYDALDDQFGLSWVYSNQALALRFLGRLDDAELMTKRGISVSREYGAEWQIVFETGNLVDIYLMSGQVERARRMVVRHWLLARRLKVYSETVRAMGNMALVNMERGRYRLALRSLRGDYQYSIDHLRLESLTVVLNALSQCYAHLNRSWRARVLGYAALYLSRAIQSNRLQIMSLRILSECLPPPEARECLEQALLLTDQNSYEQVACEVALLRYIEDLAEKRRRWLLLHDRLVEMGLGAILFDCDETHLPRLMICI